MVVYRNSEIFHILLSGNFPILKTLEVFNQLLEWSSLRIPWEFQTCIPNCIVQFGIQTLEFFDDTVEGRRCKRVITRWLRFLGAPSPSLIASDRRGNRPQPKHRQELRKQSRIWAFRVKYETKMKVLKVYRQNLVTTSYVFSHVLFYVSSAFILGFSNF
jgi:hypothetical protein